MRPARRAHRALAVLLTASLVAAHASLLPTPSRADPPSLGALRPERGSPRWPRRPLLDRAREAVGAPLLWEREGALGEGATVCVIDTGIDLRHRDFRDAWGRTRVRWLVDLEGAARGGEGSALEASVGGAVWSAEQIDAALAGSSPEPLPADAHGHGTAVASAVAGDDAEAPSEGPGPLAGLAPRASLIVVDALREGALGFEDPDLLRGARFCLEAAEDPSRLALVLALGGHDGAHDGSSALERGLAELLRGRGAAAFVAAGNDGASPIHARGRVPAGRRAEVEVRVPEPLAGEGERLVSVMIQLEGEEGSVALLDPELEGAVRTPWVGPSADIGAEASAEGPLGRLSVFAAEDDPARLYAVIEDGEEPAHPLRGGTRRILVRGPARFEAWLVDARLPGAFFEAGLAGAYLVEGGSVTLPATSPALFAVGASLSRVRAELDAGPLNLLGDLGAPAAFSSRGPNASGAPKPDLIAPGGLLLLALSGDLRPTDPRSLFGGVEAELERRRLGDRIALAGSSFAAAVAAGALALGLSAEPSLSAERGAELLRASARRQSGAWDAASGAGALDLEAFLEAARAPEGLPPSPLLSSFALTRASVLVGPPSDLFAVGRLWSADGAPAAGRLLLRLDAPGREGWRAELPIEAGFAAAAVALPPLAAGERLRVIGALADPEGAPLGALGAHPLEIRAGEGPYADLRAAGGACASSPGSAAAPPGAAGRILFGAALALLLSRLPGRRRGRGGRRGRCRPARRRPRSGGTGW